MACLRQQAELAGGGGGRGGGKMCVPAELLDLCAEERKDVLRQQDSHAVLRRYTVGEGPYSQHPSQ